MSASRFECPRCQTVFVKNIDGDAAFVECPSCGALALPAGDATDAELERALSGSHPAPEQQLTHVEQQPAPLDPAAPAPGMFSNLLEDAGAPASSPGSSPRASASAVTGSAKAPELDFDFGGIDIPVDPRSGEGPPVDDSGKFRSNAGPVHTLPPEAMSALAADADAGPTNEKKAPWSGLSEDAFGDLEKAFDEMALKPVPPTGAGRGLSTDEERFLRGDSEQSGPSPVGGRPPPLRRVDGESTGRNTAPPRPPPKKSAKEKRPRPTHFELSAEARKLAFYSLDGKDVSVSMPRPRMAQSERADRGEGRERVSAPAAEPSASGSRPVIATSMGGGDGVEATDVVRADREQPRKTVPSAFAGLTFGRAAALVLVAALLGGAGGAYLAPKAKTAATSRARAELRFADGNRFYDAGRYDDALGAFRGALSIDPTFALAHRAKGAALAKLSRFDEAAEAYDEYLKLEQNAVDSTDVKAAIQRRRGPDAKP